MRAIIRNKYGSAEVLTPPEFLKPTIGKHEVLIKIKAVSLNPLDKFIMQGTPFPLRFMTGLLRPKHKILGADVSGTVEEIGLEIKGLKVGDQVLSNLFPFGLGGLAEYAVAKEKGIFKFPLTIPFEAAAALPIAGITALQAAREYGKIKPGDKILVNGASGGVGTYAIQLAKHFGANVTGVCSSGNMRRVKELGADLVIDYTKENFTKLDSKYDLILDMIANHQIAEIKKVLKPRGHCIFIGFNSMKRIWNLMITIPFYSMKKGQTFSSFTAKAKKEDLTYLITLLEKGLLKSVVGHTYELEETAKAMKLLESGHSKGKIIITP